MRDMTAQQTGTPYAKPHSHLHTPPPSRLLEQQAAAEAAAMPLGLHAQYPPSAAPEQQAVAALAPTGSCAPLGRQLQ